jgi:hypothetical protein
MKRNFCSCAFVLILSTVASAAEPIHERAISAEDRDHWAFRSPVLPAVPSVSEPSWVRNPIDAFILKELETNGTAHAAEADRLTLLRRVTFGLTGLPPTIAEQEAFLADTRPGAYERVVDRLLDSPSHGEHQARRWLDLARYADTDGYEFDAIRPDAWRYREWVVNAFNQDMPYDEFTRRQIAGDELAGGDPTSFVATGFNRCYPDMVDQNDQGLRRQNALNDVTETTGLVFLGLTIGCARCHDHKFDPIGIADFYRLQAFFAPARFRDDLALAGEGERAAHDRAVSEWSAARESLQRKLLQIEGPARAALAPGPPPKSSDEIVRAWHTPDAQRTALQINALYEVASRDKRVERPAILDRLTDSDRSIDEQWTAELRELDRRPPAPLPVCRGIDEAGPSAPATYLLKRGDYANRGPTVEPAIPAVLDRLALPPIEPTARSTGRRSALARWLTEPSHPLTARVMVNRIWQQHFGRGIVGTPSDFGVMGDEPSHPQLLDWLALEFVNHGWSMKRLHRAIVTSSAYRQSSVTDDETRRDDPENVLVSRHSRRRLDGEVIRDEMLMIGGVLDRRLGGPGVFPELPREITDQRLWPVSADERDRNRRGLYVFVRRNLRYPFFESFDRPDTNASCPVRPVTTIAPQALSLLNGSLAHATAHRLAARLDGLNDAEGIDLAFRATLGRPPDPEERKWSRDFLSQSSWEEFALALLNVNEFVYVD